MMISFKNQRTKLECQGISYPLYALACLLFLIIIPLDLAFGKDLVTVTSDNIAEIYKDTGTVLLKGNVNVIKKSTGSSIKTDNLFLVRSVKNGQLMLMTAEGNVKIKNRESVVDGKADREVVIWCDFAAFDRKETRVELQGGVRVESAEFLLEADRINYDYKNESGKVTEIPGKQVKIKLYKKRNTEQGASEDKRSTPREIDGNAKEILINRQSGKAILQGNVIITNTSDQSRFTAERATVFFDDNDAVEEIIAGGRFSMIQPGRISSADRAVLEYGREIVTLFGNAHVRESDQVEINSSRIRIHMKVDKDIIQGVGNVPVKMKIPIE